MIKYFGPFLLTLLLAGCTNTIKIYGNQNHIEVSGARNIAENPSVSMF